MQFQVPQFIDTEDKLVGPLSLRQLVYVGAAVGASAILYFILKFGLWVVATIFLGGAGLFLAFGQFNGRPVAIFVRSLFNSIWSPSVYVFRPKSSGESRKLKTPEAAVPKKPIALKGPDFKGIKDLWIKINTSKTAVPHREKPLPSQTEPFFGGARRDHYEAVRNITGEREVAKRVDYRS
jgi:hypothetical protein